MNPMVYAFTNNNSLNLWNSEVSELARMIFQISFDNEPQQLDDTTWYDYDGWHCIFPTSEEKDGILLELTKQ